MNREYHKWHSPALGREMELLIFGHAGRPLLVFPTSMGRFFDYENRNMIGVLSSSYAAGKLQAFCVDSVDAESWYNTAIPPRQRALRHLQYERYLIDEVLPFIRQRNMADLTATGCSFGGFHSACLGFRRPDLVREIISFGGAFDNQQFLDGYFDEDCYYLSAPAFLPNLEDPGLLRRIRTQRIVLATGETDICLEENRRMSRILSLKGIEHHLDIWGDGAGHDWPWWEQMAVKYFG